MPQAARQRLDGWKAIADHLGKSVRTAQRWEEEHGLPVHRLADADDRKGASVMAFADELDLWWEATFRSGSGNDHPLPARLWQALSWLELPRAAVLVAAAGLVTLAVAAYALQPAPSPYFVRHVGDRELLAVDRNNAELWRHAFETPFVLETGLAAERARVVDVGHDGATEVLVWRGSPTTEPSPDAGVYLFDAAGKPLWHRMPGRAISVAGADYDNRYGIRTVATGTFGEGETFVAVVAMHIDHPITQVVILDAGNHGEVLGEYVHFGHVYDMYTFDVDNDGTDEIFLGGENRAIADPGAPLGTARKQAFLALIEHDIQGAIGPGVTADEEGLQAGLELAYVALPFSAEADAYGFGNTVWQIRPTPSGFHADVGNADNPYHRARLYLFNHGLEPVRLTIQQGYFPTHRSLLAEGRTRRTLAEERDNQMRVVRLVWRLADAPAPSRRP